MTKTFARRIMLSAGAVIIAGLATAAVAQPAWGPNGYGPGMMGWGGGYGPGMMGWGAGPNGGHGPGSWGGRSGANGSWDSASYLRSLGSELGITKAEEPAWADYSKAFSSVADQMQSLREGMYAMMGDGSWEDHRNFMEQAWQMRRQAFATMQTATDKLIQALDPSQRQKAQDILPGLGYGPGFMMGGGYGRRGGPGWYGR